MFGPPTPTEEITTDKNPPGTPHPIFNPRSTLNIDKLAGIIETPPTLDPFRTKNIPRTKKKLAVIDMTSFTDDGMSDDDDPNDNDDPNDKTYISGGGYRYGVNISSNMDTDDNNKKRKRSKKTNDKSKRKKEMTVGKTIKVELDVDPMEMNFLVNDIVMNPSIPNDTVVELKESIQLDILSIFGITLPKQLVFFKSEDTWRDIRKSVRKLEKSLELMEEEWGGSKKLSTPDIKKEFKKPKKKEEIIEKILTNRKILRFLSAQATTKRNFDKLGKLTKSEVGLILMANPRVIAILLAFLGKKLFTDLKGSATSTENQTSTTTVGILDEISTNKTITIKPVGKAASGNAISIALFLNPSKVIETLGIKTTENYSLEFDGVPYVNPYSVLTTTSSGPSTITIRDAYSVFTSNMDSENKSRSTSETFVIFNNLLLVKKLNIWSKNIAIDLVDFKKLEVIHLNHPSTKTLGRETSISIINLPMSLVKFHSDKTTNPKFLAWELLNLNNIKVINLEDKIDSATIDLFTSADNVSSDNGKKSRDIFIGINKESVQKL